MSKRKCCNYLEVALDNLACHNLAAFRNNRTLAYYIVVGRRRIGFAMSRSVGIACGEGRATIRTCVSKYGD